MNQIRYLLACLAVALSLPVSAQWGGVYSLRYASTPTDVASLITAPCATSAAVLYNAATPCSANLTFNPTGSLLTIGTDVVVSRYAAKQLMISGDGVGATTNAGIIAGYLGTSGYGALWGSNAGTATTTNYALSSNEVNTSLSGTTNANIAISGAAKFGTTASLNTSFIPLSITDTTDSSSTTTGSLKTAGGLGVAKKAYFGETVSAASYLVAAKPAISGTAPTIASGGCTSPTVTNTNGTAHFTIDVGTSCSGSQPVVFTLPAATVGWNCYARNITNGATSAPAQTGAVSTTSVTITNFVRTTGVAGAWTDGDDVVVSCLGG